MYVFPQISKGFDSMWVIVYRLTKSGHFLAIKTGMSLKKLIELYIDQIVRLHGVSMTTVLDRESRFVAHFWRCLHKVLGTKLTFDTTFHRKTVG